ncbi:MAG: hypothetical protein NZM12_13095, partial [Steroidobacteraceae bacterium]|nr:hypothetical protein [Steroidobacteraceae bacterium]MDW8259141.1 hypothetical protein [Gammaproteobacteria bacterium]
LWPVALAQAGPRYLAIALLLGGALLKLSLWLRGAKTPTVNEALQLGIDARGTVTGKVRLLDVGHAQGTFLTDEFGFQLARRHALALRGAALLLAFLVPAALLQFVGFEAQAAAVCVAGLLIERWLFFAEARHVVWLYHDMPLGDRLI